MRSMMVVLSMLGCFWVALALAQKEPQNGSEASEIKVRDMELKVNEVKEEIFRTKERIRELQRIIADESIGMGSRVLLYLRNEMGGAFEVLSVHCSMDGQTVFRGEDPKEQLIFNRNVDPGNHQVVVKMVLKGRGYGLFPYVEGYRFRVTSSYTFAAETGKLIKLRIVSFERDVVTTPFHDRPAVRFDIRVEKLTPERVKRLSEGAEQFG
jgi:hypothetical protein